MKKKSSVKRASGTRTRRFVRRAGSIRRKAGGLVGGKIRWGEALLSGIIGYEGSTILDSTGLPVVLSNTQVGKYLYDQSVAMKSAGVSDVTYGKVINKDLGFVALAKVGYDVIRGKRLADMDINVLVPYAIGTVFDPQKKLSGGGNVW